MAVSVLLGGSTGRLGNEIRAVLEERNAPFFALQREHYSNPSALEPLFHEPRIIVDVSLAHGTQTLLTTLRSLSEPARHNVKCVVIGTTGHSPDQCEQINNCASFFPVSLVSNFSRGVFLLEEMLQARTSTGLSVAELARSLGFDLALWEAHHTRKLDAPSGTAKTLAEAAKIPENRISATRVGNVVGEHVVFLAAESEELRIQHLAHTRKLFALGACDMIERISHLTLSPGLYDRRAFFSLPEKVK